MVKRRVFAVQNFGHPPGGRENYWVQASRSGDLEAFNTLVLKYQDLLYDIAAQILEYAPQAETATQQAFLQAYCQIHSYNGGSLKVWLLRLLVGECLEQMRAFQRPAGSEPAPRLAATLGCLAVDERIILVCVDLHGLSYQEVADVLRISASEVRRRLAKARLELSQVLPQNTKGRMNVRAS